MGEWVNWWRAGHGGARIQRTFFVEPAALQDNQHPVLLGALGKGRHGVLALLSGVQGQLVPQVLKGGWGGEWGGEREDGCKAQHPRARRQDMNILALPAC